MTVDLLHSITKTIYDNFENATIYIEKTKQGFKTPSFFIRCLKTEEKQFISGNIKVFNNIEISYFPKKLDETNEECICTANILFDKLKKMKLKKISLNGLNMKSNIDENGILKFYIDYNFYIFRNKDIEKMNRLFTKGGLNEKECY